MKFGSLIFQHKIGFFVMTWTILTICPIVRGMAQVVKQETINNFVELNAFESNEETIISEIVFYLNNRYSTKTGIEWCTGTITTDKGKTYQGLQLKFNMIDNDLFIKLGQKIYRFSNEAVPSFSIHVKGEKRIFNRGYHTLNNHTLTGEFRVSPPQLMEQITSFEEVSKLNIETVELRKHGKVGTFSIELMPFGLNLLYKFQNHMRNHVDIYNVKISSEMQSINEGLYFEHLLAGEAFDLIKLNSKKLSQGGSVSLIKTGDLPAFDDFSYYIANPDKDIFAINFSRKSVFKALRNCGLRDFGYIQSVSGEKKLIQSLKQLNRQFQVSH